MNPKTLLTRYLYFFIIIFLIINIYLPVRYKASYPRPLGPQFTRGINDEHVIGVNSSQPELILIGDSTLYHGVNRDILNRVLSMETYKLAVPGSATAAWYLVMKNVVTKSSHLPKYVVILFRDTMLTVPYYRTTGRYLELLDDYASKSEPLLVELAFINQMSPVEKVLEQYLPLYGLRWEMRERLDRHLRYLAPSIFLDCQEECADEAVESIFGREINVSALSQAMEDAATTLYSPAEMNFESHIDKSFLPPIIKMAEVNNINLVFVRLKTLRYQNSNAEPNTLRNYIKSLEAYLSANDNVYYLDFSQDDRIKDTFFADSIHFNEFGRDAFTPILADELKQLVK